MMKALAASPDMLALQWDMTRAYYKHTTLPQSLIAMISYTIATKSDCTYCSVGNELTCRTLGIDEETLDKVVKDLGNVNPQRIQAIIEFALKVAKDPQGLVRADYDKLRDQGVMEEEIVEIIVVAAVSVYADIVADALQIEVDTMTAEALGQLK
jgi:alkylhydroperoxidase family enzyme